MDQSHPNAHEAKAGRLAPVRATTDSSEKRNWMAVLAPYRVPNDRRAVFELAVTVVPFIGLCAAIWYVYSLSYMLALALCLPAAGFMLRLFMIQHDCGHGSMFSSQKVNDWVGRVIGIATLTPYDYWRRSHALHHAGSGNLDRRGMGDIDTFTIAEYRSMGTLGQLKYRLYRHPIVLFVIGPAYLFLFRHRFPTGVNKMGSSIVHSVHATNAVIVVVYSGLIYLIGWQAFFAIQLPIILLATSTGVWLFYIQHQFDPTYWSSNSDWNREDAALHGSSFYDLPAPMMWISANIGVHQVHHLSSRIPFYRLRKVLADYPELKNFGRLTFWRSLGCVRLTLWDERGRKLVPFSALKQLEA